MRGRIKMPSILSMWPFGVSRNAAIDLALLDLQNTNLNKK